LVVRPGQLSKFRRPARWTPFAPGSYFSLGNHFQGRRLWGSSCQPITRDAQWWRLRGGLATLHPQEPLAHRCQPTPAVCARATAPRSEVFLPVRHGPALQFPALTSPPVTFRMTHAPVAATECDVASTGAPAMGTGLVVQNLARKPAGEFTSSTITRARRFTVAFMARRTVFRF